MPVIPATQGVEIGRIRFQASAEGKVRETPFSTNKLRKVVMPVTMQKEDGSLGKNTSPYPNNNLKLLRLRAWFE
jgi:hypothetical protein